ncbi:MAG: FAD:protein FMN transferase [Ruminococcus sp.]
MFKKIFLWVGSVIIAAVIAVSFFFYRERKDISETGIFVMDTYCTISLDSRETDRVSALLYDLEKQFDSFDENSDISRLNRGIPLDEKSEAGRLILECISLSDKYRGGVDITAGSLTRLWDITGDNPRVPEERELQKALSSVGMENICRENGLISLENGAQLDLGAAAKGYALDRVKDILDETDTSYGVVSMTSSMLLYGEKKNGEPFRIAVRGENEGEILGTAETESCFVSSSGSYERYFTDENGSAYSHILDTKTGYPIETDLAAVTVFCQSGIMSDYLSTLIFMEGKDNIEKHLHADEYKIVAADKDGNICVSEGLRFTENKTGGKEK